MHPFRFLLRPLYLLLGRVVGLWVRPTVHPEAPAELLSAGDGTLCYVLESGGLADMLALEQECRRHGLPSPSASLEFAGQREASRTITLRRRRGFLVRRPGAAGPSRLKRLVDAGIAAGDFSLTFVPVAIYWGRSPDKERSWFKLLFSENWEVAGRTRKLFATILHGRNTLLRKLKGCDAG